jgi:hypothetical protein
MELGGETTWKVGNQKTDGDGRIILKQILSKLVVVMWI